MPTRSKKECHGFWEALADMNGGKGRASVRLLGRQFCFVLAAFIFSGFFIWSLKRNLFISNPKLSEDQLILPSPDLYLANPVEVSASMNFKGPRIEEYLNEKVKEVTRVEETTTACNYAKGRWVADSRQPLYSGFGCKQWLAEMWACRLTTRPDFSYENYHWQPEDCDMPQFDGLNFLRRMQDKTIAFVGDSLGRQQFQSLMCMITSGQKAIDVEDVGEKFGFVIPQGGSRPNGWAYRFQATNTTILFYWSATLSDIGPLDTGDQATGFAMHMDRPPAFLRQYLSQFDVLVLNTGHHWNRGKLKANRWVMHANGKPVVDRKLAMMGNAKNYTIYSIVSWLDSQLLLHPQLKAFFRTISPRHFVNGEWNSGGSCNNTIPMARGSRVSQDQSSDSAVEGAVKGTRVRILDITAISQLRDEAHISRYRIGSSNSGQDCLHWCLPGIPDTWNEILCAKL